MHHPHALPFILIGLTTLLLLALGIRLPLGDSAMVLAALLVGACFRRARLR